MTWGNETSSGSIWTANFWRDAAERAIKTAAQAAVGVLGAGLVGVLEVDWVNTASVAGLAALISLLTSVGSAAYTRTDDGSILH